MISEKRTLGELAEVCDTAWRDMVESERPYLRRIREGLEEAATRLRALDGERTEGWAFIEGMDSDHQDCINFYPTHEGEPDNHDGPAILTILKPQESVSNG